MVLVQRLSNRPLEYFKILAIVMGIRSIYSTHWLVSQLSRPKVMQFLMQPCNSASKAMQYYLVLSVESLASRDQIQRYSPNALSFVCVKSCHSTPICVRYVPSKPCSMRPLSNPKFSKGQI